MHMVLRHLGLKTAEMNIRNNSYLPFQTTIGLVVIYLGLIVGVSGEQYWACYIISVQAYNTELTCVFIVGQCDVSHCTNTSTCMLSTDGQSCKCVMGYYGDLCEKGR